MTEDLSRSQGERVLSWVVLAVFAEDWTHMASPASCAVGADHSFELACACHTVAQPAAADSCLPAHWAHRHTHHVFILPSCCHCMACMACALTCRAIEWRALGLLGCTLGSALPPSHIISSHCAHLSCILLKLHTNSLQNQVPT
jgi:hypothetical protein